MKMYFENIEAGDIPGLLRPFIAEGLTFEADYDGYRLTITFTGGY